MSEAEAPKIEASKIEAPTRGFQPGCFRASGIPTGPTRDGQADDHVAGAIVPLMNMASPQTEAASGKRRLSALAAMVALAMVAGALGGALATSALTRSSGGAETAGNHALEATVARIDADILALKASVEHTSKLGMSQFNKTSDRLDKLEKAQAEPAAKIAKLSETVDKLRAAPPAAPAPVAAAPARRRMSPARFRPRRQRPPAAPKAEVGRLPTVEGWVLRDVANGGALIEGRQGIYEVYAGDPVPGLGRVDAIRRQDGRWVVVTSKGLIVAR